VTNGLGGSQAEPDPLPEGSGKPAPFVVGVDGGGTGSRAVLMDLQGREIHMVGGPPGLVDPSDPQGAARAMAGVVREVVLQADLGLPAEALWAGLAGAGRVEAREGVEAALAALGLAHEVRVGMDVQGAHQDAFGGGPGLVLVVGTGSMGWGRDPEGREVRVGGWGSFLGEEGAGYWMGMEALRAVARAADGRGPPTLLVPAILEALHLPDPHSLIRWVAAASKGEVGALAPLVLDAVSQGDASAKDLIERGLEALGRYLDVLARAWAPWGVSFPVALCGGMAEEGGPLREPLARMVAERGGILHPGPVVAARGAARLALGLALGTRPEDPSFDR
jgi:N-acetylglucosamine kinase-like BadF-type ATPase